MTGKGMEQRDCFTSTVFSFNFPPRVRWTHIDGNRVRVDGKRVILRRNRRIFALMKPLRFSQPFARVQSAVSPFSFARRDDVPAVTTADFASPTPHEIT